MLHKNKTRFISTIFVYRCIKQFFSRIAQLSTSMLLLGDKILGSSVTDNSSSYHWNLVSLLLFVSDYPSLWGATCDESEMEWPGSVGPGRWWSFEGLRVAVPEPHTAHRHPGATAQSSDTHTGAGVWLSLPILVSEWPSARQYLAISCGNVANVIDPVRVLSGRPCQTEKVISVL